MRAVEALEPRRLFAFSTPVISEFVATNTNGLKDEDGDREDWVEIHNPTSASVNLTGYSLTDDPAVKTKWKLPAVTLAAKGYLVVFASGKNRAVAGKPLHTNFQLDGDGEYLALVKPDGATVVSQFSPGFPRQTADVSYGLPLGGTNTVGTGYRSLKTPTPGAPNASQWITADTKFSKDRGFYSSAFTVTITTATPNATIRYTTDGSAPTATRGAVYTGPVTINKTTTLRAGAFASGYLPSNVDTQTYVFVNDVIRQSPDGSPPPGWPASFGNGAVTDYGMDPDVVNSPTYSGRIKGALTAIPTISMVMDQRDLFDPATGIYANSSQDGRDWERPASVELIKPDGTKGFQIDAGVRIRGGFSRGGWNPKHGFRLFFRGEYGHPKLDYPMFGPTGAKEFDSFDLRTFQNYSWSLQGDPRGIFLRDQFSRDTQLAMGQPGERGDFYHLYINGQYWGLYNSDERPEANYAADYFGGKASDYDVIKVDPDLGYNAEATDGNMDAWNQLWNQAVAGFGSEAAYQKVQGNNPDGTRNSSYKVLLDVDNLIDYELTAIYAGNLDGPVSWFLGNQSPNNFFAFRSRASNSTGFKFVAHDSEHTLLEPFEDRSGPFPAGQQSALKSNPQFLFQQLSANPNFRLRVADHIQRHMINAGGALTPAAVKARFLQRKNEIDKAVIAESARWGDVRRPDNPLTRDVEWVAEINRILNDYIPVRTDAVLDQLRADGLVPAVAAPTFGKQGGTVASGYKLSLGNPGGVGAIYYTLNGKDPRLPTGGVSPSSVRYTGAFALARSGTVKARVLNGSTWSALNDASFTVTATTGSVAGTLFNDLDGDGVKDSNEVGLAGWRVYLDANGNGVLDTGETTLLTDASGNYRFTGLAAGSYRVRQILPSGWRRTLPSSGVYSLTLAAGQALTGKNFGNTQRVLISGTVYNDANGNGARDTGESGLSGWRVFLDRDNDGILDAGERSILTDSSGNWSFKDLSAGTYLLRVVQQSGWKRTAPSTGSFSVTLTSGKTATNKRFGEQRTV
jgi:hypothetical protein